MKEHPILMQGPFVRAILDGHKTQSRRPIKKEATPDVGFEWAECLCREIDPSDTPCVTCEARFPGLPSAGDKLWVRETFAIVHGCRDMDTGYIDDWMVPRDLPKDDDHGFWTVLYRADDRFDESKEDRGFSWRPMIHMPRWACRLRLPLVKVRIERVQSISEADAIAEGLRRTDFGWTDGTTGYDTVSAREAFRELWDSIYGTWGQNPWVAVYEWEEIEVSR